MDLILILGPMKSGKSFEMISYFAPLKFSNIPFVIFQPEANVRDGALCSRNGVSLDAIKVGNLKPALDGSWQMVGVDEIHMFNPNDFNIIDTLLKRGIKVIVSGLDMDYRGEMFEIVKKLFQLGPKEVKYKRAVCEICKKPEAIFTQVFNLGIPIIKGMPSIIPEDGTYEYKPVCRNCFKKF